MSIKCHGAFDSPLFSFVALSEKPQSRKKQKWQHHGTRKKHQWHLISFQVSPLCQANAPNRSQTGTYKYYGKSNGKQPIANPLHRAKSISDGAQWTYNTEKEQKTTVTPFPLGIRLIIRTRNGKHRQYAPNRQKIDHSLHNTAQYHKVKNPALGVQHAENNLFCVAILYNRNPALKRKHTLTPVKYKTFLFFTIISYLTEKNFYIQPIPTNMLVSIPLYKKIFGLSIDFYQLYSKIWWRYIGQSN